AAAAEDDVRSERNQFRHVPADAFGLTGAPAVVDPHVAAVTPAQLLQAGSEHCQTGLVIRTIGNRVGEHGDATHLLRLLRARRERPRDSRAAEKRDELAALHSITSSAMASSLSGIWRPSALAVLRLMASSNFVGC